MRSNQTMKIKIIKRVFDLSAGRRFLILLPIITVAQLTMYLFVFIMSGFFTVLPELLVAVVTRLAFLPFLPAMLVLLAGGDWLQLPGLYDYVVIWLIAGFIFSTLVYAAITTVLIELWNRYKKKKHV